MAALAPWLSYLDDGLTEFYPRISWLPFALEHKPLFYGTMLTAAVHLHRRRPLSDPSALFWFKAQTIRLANERLNDPSEGATDQMIMVALILLYFNVSTLFSSVTIWVRLMTNLGWSWQRSRVRDSSQRHSPNAEIERRY